MNLFLFILVALAIILEKDTCLAEIRTYCGKPVAYSPEKNTCSAGSQRCCCKPCDEKPVKSRNPFLPDGTLYYYDANNKFLYCSVCEAYHLKSSMEDISLWFHSILACITMGIHAYENGAKPPCNCPCHYYRKSKSRKTSNCNE